MGQPACPFPATSSTSCPRCRSLALGLRRSPLVAGLLADRRSAVGNRRPSTPSPPTPPASPPARWLPWLAAPGGIGSRSIWTPPPSPPFTAGLGCALGPGAPPGPGLPGWWLSPCPAPRGGLAGPTKRWRSFRRRPGGDGRVASSPLLGAAGTTRRDACCVFHPPRTQAEEARPPPPPDPDPSTTKMLPS